MSDQYQRPDETRRIETASVTHVRRGAPDLDPYIAAIGAILGVMWLVVGLVILARGGLPTDGSIEATRAEVGPFSGNIIAAVIALMAGGAFITVGTQRQPTTMFGLGLASAVFGLVWMIEPAAFGDILGINRATALIALVIGIVATVLGGVASDTLFKRTR